MLQLGSNKVPPNNINDDIQWRPPSRRLARTRDRRLISHFAHSGTGHSEDRRYRGTLLIAKRRAEIHTLE